MTPLDGSADRPGVPELDPFGTTRYVAEGGKWLTVGACSSGLYPCLPNNQLMDGTLQNQVVVADAAGNSTTWYDNDVEGARLMQLCSSSTSSDGTKQMTLPAPCRPSSSSVSFLPRSLQSSRRSWQQSQLLLHRRSQAAGSGKQCTTRCPGSMRCEPSAAA